MTSAIARGAVGALPVIGFLLVLVWLDSYKLVPVRRIVLILGAGAMVALASAGINFVFFPLVPYYDWAGAPLVEETLKASVVLFLLRRGRVGFPVDAAIAGFATGAGFAFVENLYYAAVLDSVSPLVFALRGFGTAVMHGGTTAMVAILARSGGWRGAAFGLALGYAVHAVYNLGLLPPVGAAMALLVVVPGLLAAVFAHGESGLRQWLGEGMDHELELLTMVTGGTFLDSPAGEYLRSLAAHFPPAVVADMLCLIQLSLELSIRAKGELLKREAGLAGPLDATVLDSLRELGYLERSLGPTGRRALAPLLAGAQRRAWQLQMLREAV